MPGYIPNSDSGFDGWASNFATTIAASPVTYGLVVGDAVSITAVQSAYHAAYLLAGTTPPHRTPINPATRTGPNIAAMVIAKNSALITLRAYASIIGANNGVSAAAKAAAGLTVRATGKTPIPQPGTNPILSFVALNRWCRHGNTRMSPRPPCGANPSGRCRWNSGASPAQPHR